MARKSRKLFAPPVSPYAERLQDRYYAVRQGCEELRKISSKFEGVVWTEADDSSQQRMSDDGCLLSVKEINGKIQCRVIFPDSSHRDFDFDEAKMAGAPEGK